VQSFSALLQALATRWRNTCQVQATKEATTFEQVTEATPPQARIFQLLGLKSDAIGRNPNASIAVLLQNKLIVLRKSENFGLRCVPQELAAACASKSFCTSQRSDPNPVLAGIYCQGSTTRIFLINIMLMRNTSTRCIIRLQRLVRAES